MSKLANILFTRELSRRLKEKGSSVTAVSLHPGGVRTELQRHIVGGGILSYVKQLALSPVGLLLKSPNQGAQTTLHCALTPDIVSGEYYSDCKVIFQKYPNLRNVISLFFFSLFACFILFCCEQISETTNAAKDDLAAQKLWEMSESMVGWSSEST